MNLIGMEVVETPRLRKTEGKYYCVCENWFWKTYIGHFLLSHVTSMRKNVTMTSVYLSIIATRASATASLQYLSEKRRFLKFCSWKICKTLRSLYNNTSMGISEKNNFLKHGRMKKGVQTNQTGLLGRGMAKDCPLWRSVWLIWPKNSEKVDIFRILSEKIQFLSQVFHIETFKTALQTQRYMCNNFASTKRPPNFVHFSGNEPWMAKSAQNWRNCPYGKAKFSIPDKVTQLTLQLLNVSIPVLQKCPSDLCHKNQSLKGYSRFSTKFLIFRRFRTRFSWISPHGQKSRKSDLLQNLIIYRYGAACKFLGKSYGKFLKFRIFGGYFVYVFSGAAPGPSPSLKVDLLREKANAHLERMTVWHSAFGYIFDERRAAPPAYGRRAWSKVVSYIGFFINFPKLIRVQALPEYQNGFN